MNNGFTRTSVIVILTLLLSLPAYTQKKQKPGKYPSLLWEITGNGMKKPSYLFGTMHVSSKLAFHLGDSFYVALNKVDVVAIETKPEIWQQKLFEDDDVDMIKNLYGMKTGYGSFSADYLRKGSLAFGKFEKGIEVALTMEPAMVNNLLYRSYESSTDFEEDTYLDMYIYQIGCKLKKQTTGVEDYEQTEKLVDEAYEDMYKEKNKKRRTFDYSDIKDEHFNLNDAYRNGDLDLLDSINRMNSTSDAFDEKFLYRRNEIQANSADSIMKIHPLFVGVGAAHLPGARGVIELLRKKGYHLRPIKMGERDGKQKERIENLRVPVTFNQQVAADSFYKVQTPGKLYKADNNMIARSQYADMSNGSYYVVSRLKTNGLIWGHTPDKILKKVDSLLYENIPGKIIKKESILKNGYKGFNILNRTRKGDMQRYNIFVTPFEILFFKISGTGEYISRGDEADKFFNSIELQPAKPVNWARYSAPKGGFTAEFPHTPVMSREENTTPGRWQFDAFDNSDGNNYAVLRTELYNPFMAGEDSFDLKLMSESYASSDFIERQLDHQQIIYKGYPAMDCHFKHKDSSISKVRFLIQGPHYYTILAHGQKESPSFNRFINSFAITGLNYGPSLPRKDTLLGFSLKSPEYPENKKDLKTVLKKMMRRLGGNYGNANEELDETLDELKNFSTINLSNDTTGERIMITYVRSPKYHYEKDSSFFNSDNYHIKSKGDSNFIYRKDTTYTLPDSTHIREALVTDSATSRMIQAKYMTRNGILLGAITETDTLTRQSSFIRDVFASLTLADTVKGTSPYTKKSGIYFADYFSGDSVLHKKALKSLATIDLDSTDIPMIRKAISSLKWGEKDYLDTKQKWIGKLSDIKTTGATDYLKELYRNAADTSDLQNTILSTLLGQQTQYAYLSFRDIFVSDPPVPSTETNNTYNYGISRRYYSYAGNDYFERLYDSVKLTRTIFSGLLPLIIVDDYKAPMMRLLAEMADSNLVDPKEYEPYFSKIYLEAKNELKKQLSGEKQALLQKAIKEAEEKDKNTLDDYSYNNQDEDAGNDELVLYARLMVPYWDKNPGVPAYFEQVLRSSSKRLKYEAAMLMLRNKKAIPDTLLNYFAGQDSYRYELFTSLREMEMLDKFPAKQKDLLAFAKGMLAEQGSYSSKADTLVYLTKYRLDYKKQHGWVYYFKYKEKKDDPKWKIATAGLLPDAIDSFFVKAAKKDEDAKATRVLRYQDDGDYDYEDDNGDFTSYSQQSISEDEQLEKQLEKHFRELCYSLHKSAAMFYKEDYDWYRNGMLDGLKYRD